MEDISFIILSYNSEKYLKNCLESILSIKKYNTKIFIIDNGSTDNSTKIIEEYQIKNKNIDLVKLTKNYGTTISRNIGLHKVEQDDYICILDSDTIINENAITIMIEYLKSHYDVAIVGPSMINTKGEKQIPYRKFPNWKIKIYKAVPIKNIQKKGEQLENYNISPLPYAFECDYLISACWMLRYNAYKKIGDLDEKIFYAPEDVEYCMRARKKGYKVVHLKNAQIVHYYQRISKKKFLSKVNFSHLLGLYYVLKKYNKFLREYNKRR